MLYTHPVRVRFSDTDTTGRIFFTSYVRWLDDAVIDYFAERGVRYTPAGQLLMDDAPHPHVFAIGEYYCRIHQPSRLGDELRVELSLAQQRPKVLRFAGTYYRAGSTNPLGEAWISYVYVNPRRMKAVEIPPAVRARVCPDAA